MNQVAINAFAYFAGAVVGVTLIALLAEIIKKVSQAVSSVFSTRHTQTQPKQITNASVLTL